MEQKKDPTRIIALCGKGGVGKTSVSALLTKILTQDKQKKVLAIDADPAIGLAYALNIKVPRTVDDIRSDLISRIEEGEKADKKQIVERLDYEMLEALSEKDNLAFLAIGRPERDGCYCQVNTLLKDIIRDIAGQFNYVIIDGEAGIEQINRRVMEMVTHLLLVSDISAKGRNVATTISNVAGKTVRYERIGLLINRVLGEDEINKVEQDVKLPLIGWLPEDLKVREFDREGRNFFEFPNSNVLTSLLKALNNFGINHLN